LKETDGLFFEAGQDRNGNEDRSKESNESFWGKNRRSFSEA